ncbi:MAG: alanine:cation symporter family protein [Ruminococcaceae bacterium]|nr:alanine:cation symporter family protein [Oscillospiraceae bacterium]
MIDKLVGVVNDALYTYILIVLLLICGLYFTVRTKFAPFRLFGQQIKSVTEKPTDGKSVSSFQALMVSTASRVGTGNIIGVSTAICLGGFGSVFWMWVIAVIGSATALIESTLAQIYKRRGDDGWHGGPAYYIETALHSRPLAVLFSVLLVITYGVGFNMLASYNLQSTFSSYGFYHSAYTPWIIGGVLALVVAYCLFGGGKRLVKVTGVLVPVMGIAYIGVALVIVLLNVNALPGIFSEIFRDAFDFQAIFGGFTGSCVMYGIKRGLFSNEAGVGSAPNASASADVSHPVKQGLVQILSVFLDTLLVCSATAFMCLCSGVEPTEALSGAPYVQKALQETLGLFGPIFITVAMVLFAFTTLLGNLYYVDQSLFFILGRKPGKVALRIYYILASLVIFLGAGLSAELLWGFADIAMGLMTIINIPVIIILGKYALRALGDFDRKVKEKKEMNFRAKDIGITEELDCWE